MDFGAPAERGRVRRMQISAVAHVIAVDPGTTESAVVQWNGTAIVSAKKMPNAEVEHELATTFPGNTVLIEWITSYGMRVGQEVFDTCRWIGRFEVAAGSAILVPRREVKMWHCGKPGAKDADVIGALKEKYGEKGTKANPGTTYPLSKDAWQAFALAAYWTEKNG